MFKHSHILILLTFVLGIGTCLPSYAESQPKKSGTAAISKNYQSIPEHKFTECFKKYLCRHLGKEESDIIVSKFKVSRNRPVPKGKISIRLLPKGNSGLAGYVKLKAIVGVNGKIENTVQIHSWVDVFQSIVCTSRDLKRKDIIKKDDVYLARKNISHMPADIITDVSKVVGLMIKHNVKGDTCLKGWMLEKSPTVVRGDVVTILAESGDLKVTVPGKVMEKGYLGELVRVQNAMSRKEIFAKVINNLTVKVNF